MIRAEESGTTVLASEWAATIDEVDQTQALLRALYLNRTGVPGRQFGTGLRTIGVPVRLPVDQRIAAADAPADGAGPSAESRSVMALRRATTFIEQHAADPIGLAEIAAAARLSPRALQATFRRQLDTTPLGHLRAVRLARAHADLQSARPGGGRSVSTIASSWGFSQLSRFARDYRRRYGVAPHQTLAATQP